MSDSYYTPGWSSQRLEHPEDEVEQEFDFSPVAQSFSQQPLSGPFHLPHASLSPENYASSSSFAFDASTSRPTTGHLPFDGIRPSFSGSTDPSPFTYGPTFHHYGLSPQLPQYFNNAAAYEYQTAAALTPLTATGLSSVTDVGRHASFASPASGDQSLESPVPRSQAQVSQQQRILNSQSPSRPDSPSSQKPPKGKRARIPETADNMDDGNEDEEYADMEQDDAKGKPVGACARCKALKVKCEFRTDTEPCKRCMNGGHDCVIPGRKKRRTPPKREHLLNQIREQSAQIQKLMGQLEESNALREQAKSTATTSTSHSSGFYTPASSPAHISDLTSDSKVEPEANQAVKDWIAKARDSLAEFDGILGMGGASMPKSYLVEEDFEDSGSSGASESVPEHSPQKGGEYGISVVDSNGDEVGDGERRPRPRRKSRNPSRSSSTSTKSGPRRRKEEVTMATLPRETAPFGLMAGLSLKKQRRNSEGDMSVGVANDDFFRLSLSPEPERLALPSTAPQILTRNIITPIEAELLFKLYFDTMNLSLSLLDPVLYTAQRTLYRSSFLFTVICAIASRFYTVRPGIYTQAMRCAQLAAGTALTSCPKNVELCQAFILLSLYPVPAKRWEDERGYLYLGVAIRIASDLNLHLPNTAKPLNENHAREMLNRTRVWLNCYNLDRSTGSQYGKPPIIFNSDYTANHSENWWKSSPYSMKNFDIHICAYNAELKVMASFMATIYSDPTHPTGLNKQVDFERVATETDEELQSLGNKWWTILAETDMTEPQNCFRTGLLKLAYSYARLIALSFGFQHVFGKNHVDENPFLMRCLTAASDVVKAVVNDVGRPSQRIYLGHGPEAQSVFVTFAAAFLVKLLQPKFSSYINTEKRREIRALVQSVIDILTEVAIDDRHGPKLYARFLEGLLAMPQAGAVPPSPVSVATPVPRRPRAHSSSGLQSNHTSFVRVKDSASPAPSQDALSFDRFAPAESGINPFAFSSIPNFDAPNASFAMDTSNPPDPFQSPRRFDNDIMQSMQSLTDPSVWQDITLPSGFDWMAQFQNTNTRY